MHPLIARLTAAEKGDRELDEAIATAIYGPPKPHGNVGHARTLYWDRGNGTHISVAPEYTTNLNDAKTLLDPPNLSWEICSNGTAHVWSRSRAGRATAETPELAFCIAILIFRGVCNDD